MCPSVAPYRLRYGRNLAIVAASLIPFPSPDTAMKRTLKWIGTALLAIAIIAVVIGFVLYSKGQNAYSKTYEVAGTISSVETDSVSIARGEHLANTLVCRDCHGDNLAGKTMIDAPPFLVVASNLTPGAGGVGATYSAADLDRAIRFGVRPDGRALMPMMPSKYFNKLSDTDVSDLIAYIQSLEPIDNELPASELRPLGSLIVGAGGIDLAEYVVTSAHGKEAPPMGPTVAYGEYLANMTCLACHGEGFTGGAEMEPGAPIPPDISASGAWTFDLFDGAVRRGVGAAGNELHRMMPSRYFASYSDDEVVALHEYFKTLP